MDSNLTKLSHFFWGSCHTDKQQYGLYEANVDRIIVTDYCADWLSQVAVLFSSRFDLRLIKLDTASNFNVNLIDNTVSTNWSFLTNDDFNIVKNNLYTYINRIYRASELIEIGEVNKNELVIRDLNYIYCVRNAILEMTTKIENLLYINHIEPNSINEMKILKEIDFPTLDDSTTDLLIAKLELARKKIYNTVFSEFDFRRAEKIIHNELEAFR